MKQPGPTACGRVTPVQDGSDPQRLLARPVQCKHQLTAAVLHPL